VGNLGPIEMIVIGLMVLPGVIAVVVAVIVSRR